MLVSENEQNDFVGYIPVSAATSNVYPAPLIENSNTDQEIETLTRTSSFDQETAIVAHNQSFHQENDYSKYFNTAENFNDIVRTLLITLLSLINAYKTNDIPFMIYSLLSQEFRS